MPDHFRPGPAEVLTEPDHDQWFHEYLCARGFKMTRQRRLILAAFLAHGGDLSADELFRELRARNHAVGFVTVYRTLKLLAESGIAKGIRTDDRSARYAYVADDQS